MNLWRLGSTLCALAVLVPVIGTTSVGLAQKATQARGADDPAGRNERATELTQRGLRLMQRGDSGSAVWFLREALAIDPAHASAAVGLADIYLARGEPSDARDVAQQTSTRAPGHPLLWLRLSEARFLLGDRQGAMDALREGLRHTPHDVGLLRALADASLRRGEWLRALTADRALAASTEHTADADRVAVEAALRVLVGTSDRARGLRCAESLSIVRRALSRCASRP